MQTLAILYSFRRCPYAMRTRLALLYCACGVELREVVLRDKPAQLVDASAKATVPVLVLPDGGVIDESLDVMLWAVKKGENTDLLLVNREAQLALIACCDRQFKPLLDKYKYFQRFPDMSQTDYREAAVDLLSLWDGRLADQPYLFGEAISLADLAIFPFVRQFAHVDRAWFFDNELIHLQRWLNDWLESALFQQVMQKYAQWHEGDQTTVFGLPDKG